MEAVLRAIPKESGSVRIPPQNLRTLHLYIRSVITLHRPPSSALTRPEEVAMLSQIRPVSIEHESSSKL
jgi:hypothetical protein